MKLFVILSRVPYPLEKGDKLRAYHQLYALKQNHEIVLCCLSETPLTAQARLALGEICDSYHVFQLKKWRIALNLFLCIFTRKPFQVMYFYQKWVHQAIRKLISEHQPDHIYCQLIRTAEYAKDEFNFVKTLDYQDAFSKGMERRMKRARWPITEIYAAERRRLIAYENIIFEYFDGKTIISEEDRRFIYHPQRRDIALITNGIDTGYFNRENVTATPAEVLLFTGNMNYAPNVETAIYIAEKVMPLIREKWPKVQLVLAGSSPHRKVKALGRIEGVTVTGWIDDIRSAYAGARIFIAPMQIGTGLQNKLLEAMAMELPCITSSLANKALKAKEGREILIADSPKKCAEQIDLLLSNEELRQQLGSEGRKFVIDNFSWKASVGELESLINAQNERNLV